MNAGAPWRMLLFAVLWIAFTLVATWKVREAIADSLKINQRKATVIGVLLSLPLAGLVAIALSFGWRL